MRSLLFGRKEICHQPMDYYLLTETCGNLCESYGIEISCENGDDALVRGITLSQSKILVLLSMLMEYAVTPVTLKDVVEDWVLA